LELARLQRCNQDEVAKVVIRRGLTTRQTARLIDDLLAAQPSMAKAPRASVQATRPSWAQRRRSSADPGEQIVADAWGMRRMAARSTPDCSSVSLASLGEPAATLVGTELRELKSTLVSLTTTLEKRLSAQGVPNAAHG